MKAQPDSGRPPPREALPAPVPGPEVFITTLRIEFPALIHCPPGRACFAVAVRPQNIVRSTSRYSSLKTPALPS